MGSNPTLSTMGKKSGGSSHVGPDGLTHYQRNKKKHRAQVAERKARLRDFYIEYKQSVVCADCGNDDWRVIEFDHLPGEEKLITPAAMVTAGWSEDRMLSELAKCEPVCANCHRIRTFERRADMV